ncbi:hypothetical protein F5146DRAFT_1101836 [Armillaria mellea]|nr:hypothetical protein F5146DRAFT_1101836 [Armillaria mellea]
MPAAALPPVTSVLDGLVKKFKGRTPAPSDIRSHPRFRCVVTGKYHQDALSEVPASVNEIRAAGVVHTQCAHILLEFMYFDVSDPDSSNKELDYTASVLAVLKLFGYDAVQLNGAKIHFLCNVMTMEFNVHDWLDRLEIWFEKTVPVLLIPLLSRMSQNRYKIRSFDDLYELPAEATFTTPDNEDLPVPSEALLALHAACAKVARISGAAEYIDEVDRDVENLGVLAHNGGSGEVFNSALLKLNHMNQVIGVGA